MAASGVSQILVRGLDGRTLCLQHGEHSLYGQELKGLLSALTGVPVEVQRLVTGQAEVQNNTLLHATGGLFPTCSLLLRLVGGKGGFGSLLRGAATKAGQKKSTNNDACRDMSGRRLRHVNAEKQLQEWQEDADQRELEKKGEEFIKKMEKERKNTDVAKVELAKFREQASQITDRVASAVEIGLVEAQRRLVADGKRKIVAEENAPDKRSKLLSMLDTFDEDSDEEGDEEDGREDEPDLLEGKGTGSSESSGSEELHREGATSSSIEDTVAPCNIQSESPLQQDDLEVSAKVLEEPKVQVEKSTPQKDGSSKGDNVGPLDFDLFASANELETLGGDRLKEELQSRGLKCGGSVTERAVRLFQLKTIPLDKLNRKHFSKPGTKK